MQSNPLCYVTPRLLRKPQTCTSTIEKVRCRRSKKKVAMSKNILPPAVKLFEDVCLCVCLECAVCWEVQFDKVIKQLSQDDSQQQRQLDNHNAMSSLIFYTTNNNWQSRINQYNFPIDIGHRTTSSMRNIFRVCVCLACHDWTVWGWMDGVQNYIFLWHLPTGTRMHRSLPRDIGQTLHLMSGK